MADEGHHHRHGRHKHRRQAALQVRGFLQQHLQPTLQFTVAVALCSILVFVRSITFPLACLAGVFVVVLHVLLVRDRHVGTLLLSSAGLLGAVWLGCLTAGILVTITLQAPSKAAHLALLTILASIVFGVFGIIKVTPLPFRLMLQGTNLMLTFGMSVVLSLFAPNVTFLWSYFISHLLLAFSAAALASCVVGIAVLPSFATEAAMSQVITALRKTGQTSTLCVTILLRPVDDSEPCTNAVSQQLSADRIQPAAASDNKPSRTLSLNRDASVQLEDVTSLVMHPSQELDMFMHYSTPGQWGLKSYIASPRSLIAATPAATAATAGSATAAQQEQMAGHAAAAASLVAAVHDSADTNIASSASNTTTSPSQAELAAAAATVDEEVVINLHELSTSSSSSSRSQPDRSRSLDHHPRSNLGQITPAAAAAGGRKRRHLGLNILRKLSRSNQQQHHHKQQQQQPSKVLQNQQHLFVKLGRGVDLIRPHLIDAKMMHEAVAVEQAWWVRVLVGGLAAPKPTHIEDWQNLVNTLDALLDRIAALEGMLEGGPDRSSLSSIASFNTLRSTCGVIFAQAAALCGSLSTALQAKLQQRQQRSLISQIRSRSSDLRSDRARSDLRSSCPMLGICWEASRQRLLAVLHCETQQYFARLAAADQQKPFRLEPAQAMVGTMFLSTLSLGVIEAAQKLQTAGQIVLYGKGGVAAAAAGRKLSQTRLPAAAAAGGLEVEHTSAARVAARFGADVNSVTTNPAAAAELASGAELQQAPAAAAAQTAAPMPGVAADAGNTKAQTAAAAKASNSTSSGYSNSSTAVLLDSLLCLSIFRRLKDAVLQQLPAGLSSRQALSAMVHKRRFQAGFKLWLVASIAVAAVVVISFAWPTLPPNILMFGFMAIVFTMKERVESSTEMVIIRVGSTIVGACVGHLVMYNPKSAEDPWGLAFTLLFFAFILPPFIGGQFRLMLCLGLITLNSMILCQYVGCCDAKGSLIYFLGRIVATGGGTLFAMLVNRLVLPWERDRWAMEEMSQVLGLAISAAEAMYMKEYEFVAKLTGHDLRSDRSRSRSRSTAAAAADSSKGGAAAGIQNGGDHVAIAVLPCDHHHHHHQQQQQQQEGAAVQPDRGRAAPPPPAAAAAGPESNGVVAPAGVADPQQQQQQQQRASFPRTLYIPPTWRQQQREPAPHPSVKPTTSQQQQQKTGCILLAPRRRPHQQQPQQQQQQSVDIQQQLSQMQTILAPVSLAVQRDTWMKWKWAELAIPPVVPVMLSAVQQLTDAMAALRVTLSQMCELVQQQQQLLQLAVQLPTYNHHHQQQQQQQHGQIADSAVSGQVSLYANPATTPAAVRIGSSSSIITVAGHVHDSSEWHSVMLFDEFASLVHDDLLEVFREMRELVMLVQQQVRKETAEGKAELKTKIAHIHDLRVAISIKYVKLRNQRHRNFRQRFAAQQQQQNGNVGQQGATAGQQGSMTSPIPPFEQQQQQEEGEGSDVAACVHEVDEDAAAAPARSEFVRSEPTRSEIADSPAVRDAALSVPGGRTQQQQQQQQALPSNSASLQVDVASVQYMAFVYALRRVFNRALAVARCVEEA